MNRSDSLLRPSRRSILLGAASATTMITRHAFAITPQKGGRFRVGLGQGSTTDTLDPATYSNGFMRTLCLAYNNYLVEVTNENRLGPELAESWEASKDAATWTFKLRRGAEFHNGKPITADDVISSLNYHRGKESKSAAKALVQPIREMNAPDKNTVVIILESGNVEFPWTLTDYHLVILPEQAEKIDWSSGVGAGGYKIADFKPGQRALLTRYPNYWKSDRAYFDEAELLAIFDPAARQNALFSGQLDAIDKADLKTVDRLSQVPGIKVVEVAGTSHCAFAMDTSAPEFSDNDVRLALKYAINREEILRLIFLGHGVLGNDHPISPINRFYARDLPQRQYDPERAKFHLRKAGKEGLTVELSAADAGFAGAVDASVLFKEHAAKAGIQINVNRIPNDGYWDAVLHKKPFFTSFWLGRLAECWMFAQVYSSGTPWNETQWKNAEFDRLLLQAQAELDDSKRGALIAEMQRLVADQAGEIIPIFANYVYAASDKAQHNPQVGGNFELDGSRAIERWWFA